MKELKLVKDIDSITIGKLDFEKHLIVVKTKNDLQRLVCNVNYEWIDEYGKTISSHQELEPAINWVGIENIKIIEL